MGPTNAHTSGVPAALLVVLALAYSLAFIDRSIVALMLSEIGQDLNISRDYVSLLVGTGFAFVYAIVGIAAASLLGKVHPRHTVAAGVFLWSLATATCALARSPEEFLVARMVVGAGEATLVPAAYAWIPARTSAHRVGIAVACFTIGVALGGGASLALGGSAIAAITTALDGGEWFGLAAWRVVLLGLGLGGLPFALLVWTVDKTPMESHEAAKGAAQGVAWPDPGAPALVFLGCACIVSVVYIQLFWAHRFFTAAFGLGLADASLIVGSAVALGALGAVAGGFIGDRLAKAEIALPHTTMMLGMNMLQIASFAVAFLTGSALISVLAYMVAMTANGAIGATMGPTIAQLFPPNRRALATSICLAAGTALGLGIVMPLVGTAEGKFGIAAAILGGTVGLLAVSSLALVLARHARRAVITSGRVDAANAPYVARPNLAKK